MKIAGILTHTHTHTHIRLVQNLAIFEKCFTPNVYTWFFSSKNSLAKILLKLNNFEGKFNTGAPDKEILNFIWRFQNTEFGSVHKNEIRIENFVNKIIQRWITSVEFEVKSTLLWTVNIRDHKHQVKVWTWLSTRISETLNLLIQFFRLILWFWRLYWGGRT